MCLPGAGLVNLFLEESYRETKSVPCRNHRIQEERKKANKVREGERRCSAAGVESTAPGDGISVEAYLNSSAGSRDASIWTGGYLVRARLPLRYLGGCF